MRESSTLGAGPFLPGAVAAWSGGALQKPTGAHSENTAEFLRLRSDWRRAAAVRRGEIVVTGPNEAKRALEYLHMLGFNEDSEFPRGRTPVAVVDFDDQPVKV